MVYRTTHRRLATRLCSCVLLAAAGCAQEAWLGMQCPEWGVRCDDADPAAPSGALDSGAAVEGMTTARFADAGAEPVKSGTAGVGGSGASDAQVSGAGDAGSAEAAVMCRSVTMGFFACATGEEVAGTPRLLGGTAYTLRFRGVYEVDTTFQVQGSTAACSPRMFGNITVVAGEPETERCITPSEEIALLVTVVSGDLQVWMQNGLQAEVCNGCD